MYFLRVITLISREGIDKSDGGHARRGRSHTKEVIPNTSREVGNTGAEGRIKLHR